ncbi:glycosyltransferase family 4 protein [Riemerella anatipestifer]|nr:glycosyltransferase family 4 protein [Riemerella anatipestifer]MDY3325295.1 glycosyltransferase family 4 protein [Riemerella anatipestifer]MDY3352715.1 glycosyltransferase family 4 protein [Riemerella anatipestifer]
MRKNKLKKKLLLIANVDWFFISHRLCIAERAVIEGWEVYVACTNTGRKNEITEKGIHFIDLPMSRSGMNLLQELKTIAYIWNIVRKVKPDVVHHITLKPVIYGSWIARTVGIKGVVNAISGLGYNFTAKRVSFVSKVMLSLMKHSFDREKMTIIFQNNDDERELRQFGVLSKKNKIVKIKGAGVNLDEFKYTPLPSFQVTKILFPTRMLWDKGVKELREATELLKDRYKDKIEFILVGLADTENKAGVTKEYLEEWSDGEYVKWLGYQRDMVSMYQNSHIVVLPSYREGMPRTLIEACSVGRPIITTNAIGCRECVNEGENGLKVTVGDSLSLANAIERLVNDKKLMEKMAAKSRVKAEKEFNIEYVLDKHMEIYEDLLKEQS